MTIIAFIALFIISGVRAYKTIYKFTLIDLLSAAKQSEGVPSFSPLGAAVALALMTAGYVISAKMDVGVSGMRLLFPTFIGSVCVTIGTLFLFRNFIPMSIASLKGENRSIIERLTLSVSLKSRIG